MSCWNIVESGTAPSRLVNITFELELKEINVLVWYITPVTFYEKCILPNYNFQTEIADDMYFSIIESNKIYLTSN